MAIFCCLLSVQAVLVTAKLARILLPAMNVFLHIIFLQTPLPAYPAPIIASSAQAQVLVRNASKGILKVELAVQFTTVAVSANFALPAQSTHASPVRKENIYRMGHAIRVEVCSVYKLLVPTTPTAKPVATVVLPIPQLKSIQVELISLYVYPRALLNWKSLYLLQAKIPIAMGLAVNLLLKLSVIQHPKRITKSTII